MTLFAGALQAFITSLPLAVWIFVHRSSLLRVDHIKLHYHHYPYSKLTAEDKNATPFQPTPRLIPKDWTLTPQNLKINDIHHLQGWCLWTIIHAIPHATAPRPDIGPKTQLTSQLVKRWCDRNFVLWGRPFSLKYTEICLFQGGGHKCCAFWCVCCHVDMFAKILGGKQLVRAHGRSALIRVSLVFFPSLQSSQTSPTLNKY